MKIKLFILGAALCAAPAHLVAAEKVLPHHEPASIAHVEWKKLSGKVKVCDLKNRSLQLVDKNGNVSHIVIDDSVQIFRDWRLIALNDVNVQDHLIIKRTANGLQ